MLSGKVDSTSRSELQSNIAAAALASLDAQNAAAAAAAAPSNSRLTIKVAELANVHSKLNTTAKRAEIILASFPDPLTLCVTDAAHIFSDSINTDLGNDEKGRYCIQLQILFLIRHFLASRGTMLLVYGP